jgi:hypothetical protein
MDEREISRGIIVHRVGTSTSMHVSYRILIRLYKPLRELNVSHLQVFFLVELDNWLYRYFVRRRIIFFYSKIN